MQSSIRHGSRLFREQDWSNNMFSFSKNTGVKKAFAEAKKMYETAVASPGQGKNARALRMKVMVRCRAHVDLVFIEGAKKYEAYEVLVSKPSCRARKNQNPRHPRLTNR